MCCAVTFDMQAFLLQQNLMRPHFYLGWVLLGWIEHKTSSKLDFVWRLWRLRVFCLLHSEAEISSFLEESRINNCESRDVPNSLYNLQPQQKKKRTHSVPPQSLALNDLCLDHGKIDPDSEKHQLMS